MEPNARKAFALRRAGPEDRVFLWKVERLSMRGQDERPASWNEDEELQRFLGGLDLTLTQVITVLGRDAGMLITTEDAGEIFLRQISLLPAFQNRGIGTEVVRDLLDRAGRSGRRVRLQVSPGNPARRLYERLGFVVYERAGEHLRMRWKPRHLPSV